MKTIKNPNYKQIEVLLAQLVPFTHGRSMSAERTADEYLVFSYSTIIARCDLITGKWTLNPNKYSVTTSKQQSLIRRAIGGAA